MFNTRKPFYRNTFHWCILLLEIKFGRNEIRGLNLKKCLYYNN